MLSFPLISGAPDADRARRTLARHGAGFQATDERLEQVGVGVEREVTESTLRGLGDVSSESGRSAQTQAAGLAVDG